MVRDDAEERVNVMLDTISGRGRSTHSMHTSGTSIV
jgi:hypothetical protein